MKKIITATVCLIFVSCSGVTKVGVPPVVEQVFIPTAQVDEAPLQVLKIKSLTGFNEKNKAEYLKAEVKANEIIHSKCFEDFMLARKLIQTDGLTNAEVINKIRTSVQEIDLISYYSWKGVVGYTYPNVKKIWVNSRFYNGSSVCAKASNLMHEISGHKNGFTHDFKANKMRPYSVPYSINAAVKTCCGD